MCMCEIYVVMKGKKVKHINFCSGRLHVSGGFLMRKLSPLQGDCTQFSNMVLHVPK